MVVNRRARLWPVGLWRRTGSFGVQAGQQAGGVGVAGGSATERRRGRGAEASQVIAGQVEVGRSGCRL